MAELYTTHEQFAYSGPVNDLCQCTTAPLCELFNKYTCTWHLLFKIPHVGDGLGVYYQDQESKCGDV